jgi:hypothetical protein
MATTPKDHWSPFNPSRLRGETQQHRHSPNDVFAAQRLAAGQGRGSPVRRHGLVPTRRGVVPLPQLPDRQTRNRVRRPRLSIKGIGTESLGFKELAPVPIEEIGQLFRNMP